MLSTSLLRATGTLWIISSSVSTVLVVKLSKPQSNRRLVSVKLPTL